MGADTFTTSAKGRTAEEAFRAAREDACHWHGHGGYTGTIAEKDRLVPDHRRRPSPSAPESTTPSEPSA